VDSESISARDRGHVLDRTSKCRGIGLRRFVEAAQLPHELHAPTL
jgi:hypothetical protein